VDDYYDILGVDRTASCEAIDRKIREQMRLWQGRTSSADLDRRQLAERRVQHLGEARTTLLDEEKRRRYDRQLAALRSSRQQKPAPRLDEDAMLRYRRFGSLPEPVLPADWVEQVYTDTEFEPPEEPLGSPYVG
jgi:curved DNA-binding protein CbpA